jgi:hypothetical protein
MDKQKIKFEFLSEDDNGVVFRRVQSGKIPKSKKDRKEWNLSNKKMATVVVRFFEEDEIAELQAIQSKLISNFMETRNGVKVFNFDAFNKTLEKESI